MINKLSGYERCDTVISKTEEKPCTFLYILVGTGTMYTQYHADLTVRPVATFRHEEAVASSFLVV